MFNRLELKSTYSTYENDISKEFYTPVLTVSKTYDRATAYFSSKALANYAKGLEVFAINGNKYRLLISSEISEKDFYEIKEGYTLREHIRSQLYNNLNEDLTKEEEFNLSNLAYLIAIGVIDIKIGFTKTGIFHDKFGIMKDYENNIICFRGSNNETDAAFQVNYESFDITCSWQSSEFDYAKITKSIDNFERLWKNEIEGICVCDVDKIILNKILSYNKGKLIIEPILLENDCTILDIDNDMLVLHIRIDSHIIFNNTMYKLKLKRYVNNSMNSNDKIIFKDNLTYPDFKKIIKLFIHNSKKEGYKFYTTDRLEKYIASRELHIYERSRAGLSIKQRNEELMGKFEEYRKIVEQNMTRKLREKQMWDAFFMFTMKKSSNFSVPGSGKTTSALAVFAVLNSMKLVDKIIMIGPKNSFQTWIDEFNECFQTKNVLHVFNIQQYDTINEKKSALNFETHNKNLLLFNYESLSSILTEICELVDDKTLLIFDEVHKIKAIGGKRAEDSLEISKKAQYIITMTGTPIPNSYVDIKNLLTILYRDEYNEFFGFNEQMLKNPSLDDVELINEKLQPFFCRTTKEQLQVPVANEDFIFNIEASIKENELFRILLLKYSKNKLVLIIRLLQLESNPKMLLKSINVDGEDFSSILDTNGEVEDYEYKDFSNEIIALINSIDRTNKFLSCVNLAENLFLEGKTVIIWCVFVDSILRLTEELEKKDIRVGCIFGGTDTVEREMILSEFKKGNFNILITNPHTLAESISLHKVCHDAIYFEYSYNLVHLLQSKDRIHRLGLSENDYTQYYYLQTEFLTYDGVKYSLDSQIYNRLKEKETLMLNAIENNILEAVVTYNEDLEIIFRDLLM